MMLNEAKGRKRKKAKAEIRIEFSERERELLLDETYADPDYAGRLKKQARGQKLEGFYAYDELQDMLGFLAAASNHTKSRKLQRELDALYGKLEQIEDKNYPD
jgi:hypothetical protein